MKKSIELKNQTLWLLSRKAIYWKQQKSLIVADLHIGKTGHFRKNGIPVPETMNQTNLDRLDRLIAELNPEKLFILGDLFHSSKNQEWDQFRNWREKHMEMDFILILGNHDILPTSLYHTSGIHLFKKVQLDPFFFVHDSEDISKTFDPEMYTLCGHVHPAVQLKGKGRQSMKLPCFYFGEHLGILPAFGKFTGTHTIKLRPEDRVYAIAENQILPIDSEPA